MARIRTVKPEFFRHEGLQDLEQSNPGAHCMLVFAGLWGHCDKLGHFEWRPRTLKLDVLPFLDFDMADTLDLLLSAGFVKKYQADDGREYGEIASFEKHQRISGKEAQEPCKFPVPIEHATGKQLGSNWEATETTGREGKGREEEEEGKRKGKLPREKVFEVFDFWKESLNHPGARLDAKRQKLIEARFLDGYGVEDLKRAITGCKKSPWHMGKNDQGVRYDDLTLILRDGSKVDRFLSFNEQKQEGRHDVEESV